MRVEQLARNASTGAIDASRRKLEFGYDHIGRRAKNRVLAWNSTGGSGETAGRYSNPSERRRFAWGSANARNGWLMLREVIETDANADGDFVDTGDSTRTEAYTWGRDLGGSLESAGGIGGLLAVYDDNATTAGETPTADDLAYVYCYDTNGNVGQLVNWAATGSGVPSGALVATYEYDAYGNAIASSGTYATANSYRFSTKPWDEETGLGYWGYRFYDPRLGRWISRDPIEKRGGAHVYQYSNNGSTSRMDLLGWDSPGCDDVPEWVETDCVLRCCAMHEFCYDQHCTAWSILWPDTYCAKCNLCAIVCIADCAAGIDGLPGLPRYYCACENRFCDDPSDPCMNLSTPDCKHPQAPTSPPPPPDDWPDAPDARPGRRC